VVTLLTQLEPYSEDSLLGNDDHDDDDEDDDDDHDDDDDDETDDEDDEMMMITLGAESENEICPGRPGPAWS
jgi:hypothetical protein